MRSKGRNIIVIGTSAGGLEALDALIGQLPTDLPHLFLSSSICCLKTLEKRCCTDWAAIERSIVSSRKMASLLSQDESISPI